jgi:hypothetical protein
MATIPLGNADKASFILVPYINPIIGVNTETSLSWQPLPNLLLNAPYTDEVYVWASATITFTKPDGTTDVVNGPFKTTFPPVGDATIRDITLLYTPDQEGVWTVNITWPGDDSYNAVSQVDQFNVGNAFPKRTTFAMISLRPYPTVGIGQDCLINAWVTPPPETAREYYENYTFTITKPDGTVLYTFESETEAPGTTWFTMNFDTVGEWTIKMDYPGNWYNLPCTVTRTIQVTTEQIPYPVIDTPLPTNPWTFPVNVYNREWRNIAGPWYQSNYNASGIGWNQYTEAPLTAHINWELDPINSIGGFIGASDMTPGISTSNIYSASSPNIRTIMAGRGYYTANNMIYCINMSTGQQLWAVPGTFSAGATRNNAPVLYYLGTRFIEYNAITGAVSRNLTGVAPLPANPQPNAPLSTAYTGETFFDDPYFYECYSGWYNDTKGDWDDGWVVKYDTSTGTVLWNATFPAGPLTNAYTTIYNNLLICRCFKVGTIIVQYMKALNLTTGEIEYQTPIMDTSNPDTWVYRQGPALGSGYGLVYYAGTSYGTETPLVYFAFNASTGNLAWVCRPPQSDWPWDNFFAYMPQTCGYEQIFILSYSGIYGVNVTNGDIIWHFTPGNSGLETPYNSWPFGSTGAVVGGGIVFAPETEHSPTLYYRGNALEAVDAFTGDRVWNISGYYVPTAIAYGTLVAYDVPNGGTYGFAKGVSQTTVQATANTVGSGILIQGTVTDQSSAQKDTPAIADAYMTDWMEYLHLQQPKPTDATGVSVKLTAIDSSGQNSTIGTVTSDINGIYAISWTPPAQGTYKVVAEFLGTNSYYSSSAETVVGVGASTAAAASPQPSETSSPATSSSPSTSVPTTPASSPALTSSPSILQPTGEGQVNVYVIVAAVVVIVAVLAAAVLLIRRRNK